MLKKKKLHHFFLKKLLFIPLIILIAIISFFIYQQFSLSSANTLAKQHDQLIKAQTQQAVSMLETVYEGSFNGKYSLDEAKTLGANLLRNLRYGDQKEGYFWADTTNGTNIVLYGRKDVEGKNRLNDQVNGIYYIQEIIANGKKIGGGFTNYYFPKKDGDQPLAKRSYSLYFAPFDWIIGTGYYIEDLDK
jgi:methyl-accepting chemotaxis protein